MARISYKCTSCNQVLAVNRKPLIPHNLGVPTLKCEKCNLTFSTGKKLMRNLSKQEKSKLYFSIFLQVYGIAFALSMGLVLLIDYLFTLGFDSQEQPIKIGILAGSALVLTLVSSPFILKLINKKAQAVEKDQDNQTYKITDWFVGEVKR